jgi:hypothetical protein
MKLAKCFELQQKLVAALGEDIVVGLSLVKGEYILTVSTHMSEVKSFNHGKHLQRAILTQHDLNRTVDTVVEEVVRKVMDILVYNEPSKLTLEEIEAQSAEFAQQSNREFAQAEVKNLISPQEVHAP